MKITLDVPIERLANNAMNFNRGDIINVTFEWAVTSYWCYDCGLPAVYYVKDGSNTLCAICAAEWAAAGDTIVRFWKKGERVFMPQKWSPRKGEYVYE